MSYEFIFRWRDIIQFRYDWFGQETPEAGMVFKKKAWYRPVSSRDTDRPWYQIHSFAQHMALPEFSSSFFTQLLVCFYEEKWHRAKKGMNPRDCPFSYAFPK